MTDHKNESIEAQTLRAIRETLRDTLIIMAVVGVVGAALLWGWPGWLR